MMKRLIKGTERVLLWAAGIGICISAVVMLILMVSEYKPQAVEKVGIVENGRERSMHEGDQIEILTFNIGYGGLDAGMDSFLEGGSMNTPESREKVAENLKGLIGLIREQSYDVLFLQEVDRDSRRSYHIDESEMLEKQLGGRMMFAQDYRCLYTPYPVLDPIGRINSGVQTQTGLKIRSSERIALPSGFTWPTRVCMPKRCMLVTRIPIEDSGRELVLINVHLEENDDGAGREAQTEALFEFMQQEYDLGNYVIAGGDFNQAFPNDNFSRYPIRTSKYYMPGRMEGDLLKGDWTFASDISTPTRRLLDMPYEQNRWWTQYYVVDGFILSPNICLDEIETIDAAFEYSDHNPVWMKATLL